MSRNGSGTYSIPNTLVAGTTITAAGHNQNYSDIATELTNSVAADGQTTMSAPLKAASGTAAAPSIAFGSDTDTGMYRKASNELGWSTGGTLAGYFDSAQKLWVMGALDVAGAGNITGALTVGGVLTVTGAQTFTGAATFASTASVAGVLTLSSTSHVKIPSGTTAQAPAAGTVGQMRFNSTTAHLTIDNGSAHLPVLTTADFATADSVQDEDASDLAIRTDRLKESNRVAAAAGFITISGGVGTVTKGVNAASVTNHGDGDYTVNFTTALNNANYSLTITALGASASYATIFSQSTTGFRVKLRQFDGSFGNPNSFNFIAIDIR